VNWYPLATGDPLAGEPQGILQLTRLLNTYAGECLTSAQRVKNLGNIDWNSDAATAFKQRREAFVPKLETVSQRLSLTAGSLQQFAVRLDDLQSSGLSLRSSAQQIKAEIEAITPLANEQHQHNVREDLGMVLGKPPTPWPGPDYMAQLANLQSSFGRLQVAFDGLVSEYGSAASVCTNQLQAVSHDSLANNLFSVFGYFVDVAESDIHLALHDVNYLLPGIARILHDEANVLAIVSLFCPELAPALIVLSLVNLGLDLVLRNEGRRGPSNFNILMQDVLPMVAGAAAARFTNVGIGEADHLLIGTDDNLVDPISGVRSFFQVPENFASTGMKIIGKGGVTTAAPLRDVLTPAVFNFEAKALNYVEIASSVTANPQFMNFVWSKVVPAVDKLSGEDAKGFVDVADAFSMMRDR
jgi:hypothetical protein